MTELERARAHLLTCQQMLYWHRKRWSSNPLNESAVLAALSWVWEEQQKEDTVEVEINWRATPIARHPGQYFVQIR